MPSKIRVLDELTINQIAAGEVIENPASVVKELTENSLDAGADEICIEIKGGGRQLIRIRDNGCGMSSDDALLSLERHATSKIRHVDDIHAIHTMGFRGEAIPSIAAISKFSLLTNDRDSDKGTLVLVEGGRVLQHAPAACARGSVIEVKSLFFNVPVRKKFQRSPSYDTNEILKMVISLALGYPRICFKLISDQQPLMTTSKPKADDSFHDALSQRVREVLGEEFLETTCPIESAREEFRLNGVISLPSHTRHNRTGQYLFINQRAVTNVPLAFAIREGYGTMLSTGRHPLYVLHLTLPGEWVDINVHPQKREVRLRQEQTLKEMVVQAIHQALQQKTPPVSSFVDPVALTVALDRGPSPAVDFYPKQVFAEMSVFEERTAYPQPPTPRPIPMPIPLPIPVPIPRAMATLKRYILADGVSNHTGLCLIDQRAAHARILFEKWNQRETTPVIQNLLLPHSFTLTPPESALLLAHIDTLNKWGLAIHPTGPHTFSIEGIPQFLGNSDLSVLVAELLQSLRDTPTGGIWSQERLQRLATAASRAAVANHRRLSLQEAQALLEQLLQCQTPMQCPFGKPTWIILTEEELEKRFQKG